MIIKASEKHIPFIQLRLAAFKNVDFQTIHNLISRKNEYFMVDEEKGIVSRVSIQRNKIKIVWLLPVNAPKYLLFPVLQKTLETILVEHPDKYDWLVYGQFKSGRGCLLYADKDADQKMLTEWKQYWPNVAEITRCWWDGKWEVNGRLQESVLDGRQFYPINNLYGNYSSIQQ